MAAGGYQLLGEAVCMLACVGEECIGGGERRGLRITAGDELNSTWPALAACDVAEV